MQDQKLAKIALVGASCTGKTSLFDTYRQQYAGQSPRVTFVSEAAREYFQTHSLPDRFTQEVQRDIQLLMLKNEEAAPKENCDIILCDSSTIDPAIYTLAFGDSEGAEALISQINFWLPTYTKFLLLNPADVPFENDEVRNESEKDRENIHQTFIKLFTEKNIPYEVLSGSLEERVAKLHEYIVKIAGAPTLT